jgi:predicted permease
VLLASSGLVLQGVVNLRRNDPGFTRQGLLTLRLTLPDARYPDVARARFVGEVLERLESHPSSASVAATTVMPAVGSEPLVEPFTLDGRGAEPGKRPGAAVLAVTPGFFETMGIRVLRGRAPDATDREGSLPTAVVSQGFTDRWLKGIDPIGARIHLSGTSRTIVGVVGDVRTFHLNVAPRPTVYVPYTQRPSASLWVVLRTADVDQASLMAAARREIHSLDSEQPVRGGEWASTLIERSLGGFDMTGLLVAVLAVVATGLAALGIYGVVAFSVARRTRELGIRISLGATPAQVATLVMGEAMKTAAWGAAPGLLLALGAGRLLASKLHRVSAFDPVLLAGVGLAVAATVLLASWRPARQAARVDPVLAMRFD